MSDESDETNDEAPEIEAKTTLRRRPRRSDAGGQGEEYLTRDVLAFANRVHKFLEAQQRPDLAARITTEAARWNEDEVAVIVAGEMKRGKSSLLNALIGHPGLLPVDADVATAVHLVIRAGEPGVSVTRRDSDGEMTVTEIDADQLVDYASMGGDEALRDGVTSVEVRAQDPLLEAGVSLVDTPGVGGMTRGHRDVTMSALQRADVLMFTVSAQDPVSRTELEFLAEASERIEHVILVVTKSDLNTDERNEKLIAEDRKRLKVHHEKLVAEAKGGDERAVEIAQRFGRFVDAPFVLTSSYLVEQAIRREERGRADSAAEYRERSGIDALRHPLLRTIETRTDLRLANIVQLASILVADLQQDTSARLRAISGDRSVETELQTQQEQLEAFASKQAKWRGRLGTGIQRLQTTSGRSVSRELNLVKQHYAQLIEDTKDLDALQAVLPAELERSLVAAWTNLADLAARAFTDLLQELLTDFGMDGLETVLGDLDMPPGLRELIEKEHGSGSGEFSMLQDGLPITMQTFMFGNMANAAAGMLGLATGGLGLVAYGIGAAVAIPIAQVRKKQQQRQKTIAEYQRVLNEALFGQEGIAKEFSTELSLRIIDLREQIEEAIDARLTARRAELEQRRRELQGLLKGAVEQRNAAKHQGEKIATELAAMAADADKLRGLVHRSLSASAAPAAPPA